MLGQFNLEYYVFVILNTYILFEGQVNLDLSSEKQNIMVKYKVEN